MPPRLPPLCVVAAWRRSRAAATARRSCCRWQHIGRQLPIGSWSATGLVQGEPKSGAAAGARRCRELLLLLVAMWVWVGTLLVLLLLHAGTQLLQGACCCLLLPPRLLLHTVTWPPQRESAAACRLPLPRRL